MSIVGFKDDHFRYKFTKSKVLASFLASSGTVKQTINRITSKSKEFESNKNVFLEDSFLRMLNSVYGFSLCVLNAKKKQNFFTTVKLWKKFYNDTSIY
jgi:hypothetical protein